MGMSIEGFISYAFISKPVIAITLVPEAFCVIFQKQFIDFADNDICFVNT